MRALRLRDPTPLRGTVLGLVLVGALTALLVPFRAGITLATPALVLMVAVVVAALIGGRGAAVITAAGAALAFNVAFIRPYWTLNIAIVDDLVAFVVFAGVGVAIGTLVAVLARRRRVAEQRAHDLQVLHEEYERVQADRERLGAEATRVAVLEQVDAQRAALLRSVSHDLRTPLSVIEAVVTDLRSGAGYDGPTRDELLDLVIGEAQRLDRLVANLLSLSRIEAGALRPERQAVSLPELVTDCAKRLDRLFAGSRVQLEIPSGLPFADADYSQLDQVMTNLLENAARHAPRGSTITVGAARDGEGTICVWVADEGPGIPDAARPHVFEPFWGGAEGATSGIGLAICRAVVEAHGGSIRLDATSDPGARFEFTIPARDA